MALALSRAQDITVDVYEAAKDFAEIGAGISIRPRTHRFLGELGLMDETFAINGRPEDLRKGESGTFIGSVSIVDLLPDVRFPLGPALSHFLSDKPEREVMSNFLGEGMQLRLICARVLITHV